MLKLRKGTIQEEKITRAKAQERKRWPAFDRFANLPIDQRTFAVVEEGERELMHLVYAVKTDRTQARYDIAQTEMHQWFLEHPVTKTFFKKLEKYSVNLKLTK